MKSSKHYRNTEYNKQRLRMTIVYEIHTKMIIKKQNEYVHLTLTIIIISSTYCIFLDLQFMVFVVSKVFRYQNNHCDKMKIVPVNSLNSLCYLNKNMYFILIYVLRNDKKRELLKQY